MANKWMSRLTKDFGIVAANMTKNDRPIIPTPSPSLNWALTTGGWKPGKVVTLFGPESSGKSMMAMMGIIELQKQDPEAIAVWFDAEFSFSPEFFQKLGGDLERLVVRRSNDPVKIFDYMTGEMLELLQDGAPIRAIAIDSIRGIRYPKDMKKVSTDMIMGGSGANYLPSAFKGIIPIIAEYQIAAFFVQQVQMQLDTMKALRNPYVIPDGNALKHASDFMLEITKVETKAGVIECGDTIAGGTAQLGHKIRVKVRKNRLGVPARVAQFSFHYEQGVVGIGEEIFELGKVLGVITHPLNPETGKENVQMWTVGKYPAVRGEANMKMAVAKSQKLQDEIMAACQSFKETDKPIIDADGMVVDSVALEVEDVSVDL